MNKKHLGVMAGAALLSCAGLGTATAEPIGVPAEGGTPEQLFLEKVKKEEAHGTAEIIAKALAKGRLVIFAHMPKLSDPELGDKGFTADYFAEQWLAVLEQDLIMATPAQKRILDKLVKAGKQSIDNNQERLNVKGIGWKNFLPAKWARETGVGFTAMTGILTKQPARNYRNPSNVPDAFEKQVLTKFIRKNYDGKPYGEFAQMGTQRVYRYFEPIHLMEPCLACHGKPKGEPDRLGFKKDGLAVNDVIALISVTVPVED